MTHPRVTGYPLSHGRVSGLIPPLTVSIVMSGAGFSEIEQTLIIEAMNVSAHENVTTISEFHNAMILSLLSSKLYNGDTDRLSTNALGKYAWNLITNLDEKILSDFIEKHRNLGHFPKLWLDYQDSKISFINHAIICVEINDNEEDDDYREPLCKPHPVDGFSRYMRELLELDKNRQFWRLVTDEVWIPSIGKSDLSD